MAELAHNGRRGGKLSWWRKVVVGVIAGFFILQLRKLLIGPDSKVATQTATSGPNDNQLERPKTAFEPTDWKLWPVAAVYIGTLVLLVVSVFVLVAAYPGALPDADRTLNINPPGPMLQTDPQADLQKFRAEEGNRLHSFYWIDKDKGILHIPIEQAMEKLARTGINGFPEAQK
jgi:hypothetical protein